MKKRIPFLFLIITSLLLAGCRAAPAPVEETETPTVLAASPTITTAHTTPLPSPTPTPTQAPTISPIVTGTHLPPPTPTSLPVISTSDVKEILTSFVHKNGGCQLPCLLGLTPGKSDQVAIDAFTGYFREYSYRSNDQIDSIEIISRIHGDQGGVGLLFWENRLRIQVDFGYVFNGDKLKGLVLYAGAYQHSGEGVDEVAKTLYGNPAYLELLAPFTLPNILSTYGPPAQIMIRPFPDDPGYPSPPAKYNFDFVLFYPEQGFLIEYISEREEKGDYYIGCPTKSYIVLSTWDPKDPISIADAVQYISAIGSINSGNVDSFYSFEEVTSLRVDEFYKIFKDPNNSQCIETPMNIWPNP